MCVSIAPSAASSPGALDKALVAINFKLAHCVSLV